MFSARCKLGHQLFSTTRNKIFIFSHRNSSSQAKSVPIDDRLINDTKEILLDKNSSYSKIAFRLLNQAKRSVYLQVPVKDDVDVKHLIDSLHEFCLEKGKVLGIHHVSGNIENVKHFIVEFADILGIQNLSSSMVDGGLQLRVARVHPLKNLHQIKSSSKTTLLNGRNRLKEQLQKADNMCDQMDIFYNKMSLSSSSLRTKFFVSSLLGDYFSYHLKRRFSAVPFGSSVFGLGSDSSDVDMTLCNIAHAHEVSAIHIKSTRCLTYGGEERYTELRKQSAAALFTETGNTISSHIDGIEDVVVVDKAIVPILSLNYSPLNTKLDISFDISESIKMAWYVNSYVRMDKRVSRFLFLLRVWAKSKGITQRDGATYSGFTPFMITCLGLFYLMRVNPAVIPPMRQISNSSHTGNDLMIGRIRCDLVHDLSKLKSKNTTSVQELFMDCLEFYSTFSFETLSLNLSKGITLPNFYKTPVSMYSLLSRRNITRNCNSKAANNFKKEAMMACRILETRGKKGRHADWGILSIIDLNKKPL